MANRRRQRQEARSPLRRGASVESSTSTDALGTRFMMHQRLVSIGQDFWIENDRGQKIFKVDGKALRIRGTLMFEDARGNELYKIQERLLRVRETMNIADASGRVAARVHNALITPLRDRWQIDVPGQQNLSTQGNILHHEYQIRRGRQPIAIVSKKWFRLRDTYGVEVAPQENAALLLAITAVIDMMAHAGR